MPNFNGSNLYAAAQAVVFNPHTRVFLQRNDPMLLKQIVAALEDFETQVSDGQPLADEFQRTITRRRELLSGRTDPRPWIGKENYFELYSGMSITDEANTAFCDFAQRLWDAIRGDSTRSEINALIAEFRQLVHRYRDAGAGDSEPPRAMMSVLRKASNGTGWDDAVIERFAEGLY